MSNIYVLRTVLPATAALIALIVSSPHQSFAVAVKEKEKIYKTGNKVYQKSYIFYTLNNCLKF